VDIVRQVLRRDGPVTSNGPHYPLPYRGPGAVGVGKPLRANTHPLRADVPIYLGAEGPKNVAQTVAIADGWLPLYFNPFHPEIYADQLRGAKPGFEIAPMVMVNVHDDLAKALLPAKMSLAFYVGGMGAKEHNFHKNLMARMGYEAEAGRIQELFMAGKREEAVMAVPDRFADEITLCGPKARIRDRLQVWRTSPVTTLLVMGVSGSQMLRDIAELAA
jgi:F420-dependent oxidoreductase-like protein